MLSKKRKIDKECHVVQEKWRNLYFFAELNGKPTCLIGMQHVAVAKEYNVRGHYDIKHAEKYDKYIGKLSEGKVSELEKFLKKQQSLFTNTHQVSKAAVKASYLIAHELVRSPKPFSDGEIIKKCMLMTTELICPDKQRTFANISLSRNTVAERISDLSESLNNPLKDRVMSFITFSIAVDDSTDVTDVAQLAIFIHGVDKNMSIIEEFVELVPMKDTTTGDNIFNNLVEILDRLGVDWMQAVSLATDGAPQMVGRKAGVAAKLKEKLLAVTQQYQFCNLHCILHQEALCSKTLKLDKVLDVVIKTVNFIRARGLNHRQFNCLLEVTEKPYGLPYHTDVRWLSWGAVLKRCYELRDEIQLFFNQKGKVMPELQDNEWLQDLAFMVDIT
ncbi:general transcription factor II-I repeat domain-containing protein 2A-like [Emydura macquarii macquarii]|uniref:general transcription factor II-I repeat domain-containing protein 2A-like n=1 Tax=Emydura macquarii macquarii TaxID=1129001 RepID=UPI00352B85B7